MLSRAGLSLLLLLAVPACSQVVPAASGGSDGSQMQTPPPVSGESYPTLTGAEARSKLPGPWIELRNLLR